MKKKENAALRTQVDQYEKLLNEVSKEMEDSEIKPQLDISIVSKKQVQNSKLKTQKSDFADTKRYENTANHLNKVIAKERAKIR